MITFYKSIIENYFFYTTLPHKFIIYSKNNLHYLLNKLLMKRANFIRLVMIN